MRAFVVLGRLAVLGLENPKARAFGALLQCVAWLA